MAEVFAAVGKPVNRCSEVQSTLSRDWLAMPGVSYGRRAVPFAVDPGSKIWIYARDAKAICRSTIAFASTAPSRCRASCPSRPFVGRV